MADKATEAPVVEAKAETTVETQTTQKKEETVGEAFETTPKTEVKEETVPLSVFLDLKKDNKEFKKSIKELESKIAEGATKVEISSDLEALAAEHDIDPNFLAKFAGTIKAQVRRETEDEIKPLKEKDRAEKIDTAFNTHFEKAIKNMPEFEGIVNKEIIKSLSLDPKNSNKTFTQLIEEAYGNAIAGKRTIETTTPRGGKEPEAVDFARANRDADYLDEVLSNPQTKKEYNDGILSKIRL